MTPYVGQIVLFRTRGSADGVYPPKDFAAIVTEMCSQNCVCLVTFGPGGMRFEQHVERGYGGGQWREIAPMIGATANAPLNPYQQSPSKPRDTVPTPYYGDQRGPNQTGPYPGQLAPVYNGSGKLTSNSQAETDIR